ALRTRSVNPMELKMRLAREIVTQFHSDEAAQAAEEDFTRVFREREAPEEPEVHEVHFGQVTDSDGRTNLARLLARLGVVPSRSEAKRLIGQGAVEIDGKVTTTDVVELTDGMVLRVGKRRFLRIVDADKQSQS
ncbi:unnamed protein product, partial [marine sediment metagenome]